MDSCRINSITTGMIRMSVAVLTAWLIVAINADAQYFGRNKPGYSSFRFDVLQTPAFEIYHYMKNDSLLKTVSGWSEEWFAIHQQVFRDTFERRNPLIFYNNHADFQQTNAVSSLIGTGTGGITEGMKNRVIMPVALTLAQTDHTLGHELVHAFQFNMFTKSDTTGNYSLSNIPLWMIEGMAEYFSLGSVDPNTAMWMRDALLNKDFPTLKKLTTDSRYFPYRYGQAFWAMVGKTWGDTTIIPLFRKTARYGFSKAADTILGMNEETLSGLWASAMEVYYKPYLEADADELAGRRVITDENGGRINISPAISPDGKYIAFFSEKNIFTLDLFIADAASGKIISKVSGAAARTYDDFNYVESGGSWSPDGRKFVFVLFSDGINKLAFVDTKRGKITREVAMKGVPALSNPSWSPDGRKIVFSGSAEGITDLYLYDIMSGEIEQLTDDFTSNIHPSWSADGRKIVFSQEKLNDAGHRKFSFTLAILDMKTREVSEIDIFDGAYNMNPAFSYDDRHIFFLSDADGFRNMYKYEIGTGQLLRLTSYMTGVSGITPYSPAMSWSRDGDKTAYNYYIKNSYHIVVADVDDFKPAEADGSVISLEAGTLPPLDHAAVNLVDSALYSRKVVEPLPDDSVKHLPYKPRFKLDYISNNASVGVSTGIYRNNLGGSINMIFSDMIGDNQLYSSLSLNGEIYDFAGQAAYISQKGRIKWGTAVSHIPYRAGTMSYIRDSIILDEEKVPVDVLQLDYIRMFEDNITLYASLPFSQIRRIEATASASWYYYRIDRFNYYYLLNGYNVGGTREKMPAPEGSRYQQLSFAYVKDNSMFGMTAPMHGGRARFQVDKYFGATEVFTRLIDYRQYMYLKPVTLAFRLYNYGMYGKVTDENVLQPLYIGYPWLIRGYENISYNTGDTPGLTSLNLSRLNGTRMAVANAELRFPFTGPERLALIKSKWILTDLNLFFDAGMAWYRGDKIIFNYRDTHAADNEKFPLYSTGLSVRINLLGYLVLEPYYAFPLQNGGFRNGVFGLNFLPGW
jgi:Tol biopolymer transport system component